MKFRKLLLPLIAAMIFCMLSLTAAAADSPRLVDGAGLLTSWEASDLLSVLDEISERQQLDIVIVTTDSLGGKDAQAYADDFFDYNGYGFGADRDGILLLIDMGERYWAMSTSGYGITAFTDAALAYLENCFLDDLSAGRYADALGIYAAQCDELITLAKQGTPYGYDYDYGYDYGYDHGYDYDYGYTYETGFDTMSALGVSAAVGGIAALLIVLSMRSQLKSVRKQNAGAYQRAGSMQVTESRDMFLYRNVTKTVRQDNNSGGSRGGGGSSVHRSSSGRSHGGRSGRF